MLSAVRSAPTSLLRWLTLAIIVAVAFWLRTRDLDNRPMHADEANQAVKLGELIESGRYAFDPRDHHGPTLYFAGAAVAWIRGERTLTALTETTVRLVPAFFGTVSVLLIAALATTGASRAATRDKITAAPTDMRGRAAPSWPGLAAAAFLAVSPPSVYYSRYFVQETLLVTFTLATFLCVVLWWRRGHLGWAIAAGVSAGLMQATKASAPLFLACAAVAAVAAIALSRQSGGSTATASTPLSRSRHWKRALLFAVGSAFLTAALNYSSFGTHPAGVRDALGAYAHALTRFGAAAEPTGHEKAWWYYLRMFGWYREGGMVWHQIAFSPLIVAGVLLAIKRCRQDPFLTWSAVYAVLVAGAFSYFAYKTPWHAVHFIPGFALLAASAVAAIGWGWIGRIVGFALTLVTIVTLYQQTQRVAFLRPADQRNPYAYVHSTPDVRKYRAVAEAAGAAAPDQPIRVISDEYWPLPWYLRGIDNVGFYTTPPEELDGALLIVAADQAEAVRARLRRTYHESFLGLRPGVICVLFILEP